MNLRLVGALSIVIGAAGCTCQSEILIGPQADGGAARVDSGLGGGAGGGGGMPMLSDDGGCGLVTCESANAGCGLLGDGCSAVIDCGSCKAPQTCGGGGTPSVCGGTSGCVPKTCSALSAECGPMADGCGGLLSCGTCQAPEVCGGAGVRSKCGLPVTGGGGSGGSDGGSICSPLTCAGVGAQCGVIGDGCGGIVMCGGCASGKSCGGGGAPYQCGGGNSCVPRSCPPGACGAYGDGCGSILNCAGACASPATCGGGGVANVCGGGSACTPARLSDLLPDGGCGFIGDRCGGILDAGVNACLFPLTCGAGGLPNRCGGAVTCVARSCVALGVNCGQVGDGCGGIQSCGGCTDGGTCGGGGAANVCGARSACVPQTCASLGKNCGQVGDGCGGLTVDCGTCTSPDICGGGGTPSICGSVAVDAGVACTNLCTKQTCPSTTLTGTVFAPTNSAQGYGNPDPVPNALIYVPNGTVTPFDAGVACDRCSDGVSGSPLISTYAKTDGTFSLANVPCGVDVPVVIQLGRWRRQITVPAVQCCVTTSLTATQTRLPRRQAEGHPNDNIPLIAVVTGSADSIENVLPKIGIDQTPSSGQYSNPGGSGRVRFYLDNGYDFGSTPAASTLWGSLAELKKYDMVVLDCVGGEQLKKPSARANLEAYANAGGRVFASHFSYVWLYGDAIDPGGNRINSPISFTPTATWNVNQDTSDLGYDAFVDISFAKGKTFADWLQLPSVNAQAASSTPAAPKIRVTTVRHDIDAVNAPAQRWVFRSPCVAATCSSLGYTCGKPVADGCGNTLDCGGCGGRESCGGGGVAGQCGRRSTCVPKTCAQLNFACGVVSDGCGNDLNCGSCSGTNSCGGGTVPGQCGGSATQVPLEYTFNTPTTAAPAAQCGRVLFSDFHVTSGGYFSKDPAAPMTPQEKVFEYLIFDLSSCIQPDVQPPQTCTPRTCTDQGLACGAASDGCGKTYPSCGTCMMPATCGGGGVAGQCGVACAARTCPQLGFNCGPQGDGCGGTLQCGMCPSGQTCGGGGTPGVCGGGTCVPKTCTAQNFNCGLQGDGCGGTLDCGMCMAPDTCGGAGMPGRCGGGSACVKQSCTTLGFNCGQQTDGCGATQDCGMCGAPQTCGGGGLPGVCGGGGMCVPRTCLDQGFDCGMQGDGCGGTLSCGACVDGKICGASKPGVCGAATCKPLTCAEQQLFCGPAGDGCGNLIQCGNCPAGDTCGGGGTPGTCGHQNCTPRTCAAAGANCGAIADGCGSAIDCGQCATGSCGGAGQPNVCGSLN